MELARPSSTAEAVAELRPASARALAGGTELVPLLRDGIVGAERLVDVRGAVPQGVRGQSRDSPLTIGAATTLAELERDSTIPDALREACRLAASPQLRNMGTIGGNLLQATRCWYWRLDYPCRLHGGDQRIFERKSPTGARAFQGGANCGVGATPETQWFAITTEPSCLVSTRS